MPDLDTSARFPAVVEVRITRLGTASGTFCTTSADCGSRQGCDGIRCRERVTGGCTGTLISPTHVLLAAHCVAHLDGAIEVLFGHHPLHRDGDVSDSIPVVVLGSRTAQSCAVHPDWDPLHLTCGHTTAHAGSGGGEIFDPRGDGAHDLAVLTLTDPVPPAWVPSGFGVDHHRLFSDAEASRVAIGDALAVVGYGSRNPPTFVAATGRCFVRPGADVMFFRDFLSTSVLGLDAVNEQLEFMGPGGASSGDSGGPALWLEPLDVQPGHAWREPPIAVASEGQCTEPSTDGYTTILSTSNRSWLAHQLDQDADGRSDVLCGRRPAIAVLGLRRECSTDAACPAGTTCRALRRDAGECVGGGCSASRRCPADQACVLGDSGESACVVVACRSDVDCIDGASCFDRQGIEVPALGRRECVGTGLGWDPLAVPLREAALGLVDLDADGVVDEDDSAPMDFNPCQEDRDQDGVADVLDFCPEIYDPTQNDPDHDGLGSACDNCPLVANPDQRDEDVPGADGLFGDFDGIGAACDICPSAVDPAQANCNEDAEIAFWHQECDLVQPDGSVIQTCPLSDYARGDACDSTPCGETVIGDDAASPGTWSPTELRIDARAALAAGRVLRAETGLRFCRCPLASDDTLESRDACRRRFPQPPAVSGRCGPEGVCPTSFTCNGARVCQGPALPDLGDCALLDVRGYEATTEPARWRWTTTTFSSIATFAACVRIAGREVCTPTRTLPEPGAVPFVPANVWTDHAAPNGASTFENDLVGTWLYQTRDIVRWQRPVPAGLGDLDPFALGERLRGVLWTHTPRARGGATSYERELASRFWSGPLDSARPIVAHGTCLGAAFPFPMSSALCPACAGEMPRPWMGFGRCPDADVGRLLVDVDGLIIDPSTLTSQPLPDYDFEPVWVAAAEPPPFLTADAPRLLALAPGLVPIAAFAESGGKLVELLHPKCPPGQCVAVSRSKSSASGSAPLGPIARTGEARVLSAQRGELFVLGGRDAGGQRLHDAWAFDIGTGAWRELGSGAELGVVLGATYDPARHELFVLDEVPSGRGAAREARVVRLDASGLYAEVVARFPRVTRSDRFALAEDAGGHLWIAASPPGAAHVIIELVPDLPDRRHGRARMAGMRIGRFVAGAGRLAAGDVLRADPLGVSVVVEDRARGIRTLGYEYRSFVALASAASRCF